MAGLIQQIFSSIANRFNSKVSVPDVVLSSASALDYSPEFRDKAFSSEYQLARSLRQLLVSFKSIFFRTRVEERDFKKEALKELEEFYKVDEQGESKLSQAWLSDDQIALDKAYDKAFNYFAHETGVMDLDACDNHGHTLLHYAIMCRQPASTIQNLISAGAYANVFNQWKETPLHLAVTLGYVEGVKALIKEGADVNAAGRFDHPFEAMDNLSAATPLHLAVMAGDKEMVKLLLEAGASEIACVDGIGFDFELPLMLLPNKGYTPLHFAAEKGNMDIVKLLLNHMINPHIFIQEMKQTEYSEEEFSPLDIAIKKGKIDVVKIFIENEKVKVNRDHLSLARDPEIKTLLQQKFDKQKAQAPKKAPSAPAVAIDYVASSVEYWANSLMKTFVGKTSPVIAATTEVSSSLRSFGVGVVKSS